MNRPHIRQVCLKARELVAREIPYRHAGRNMHGIDCSGFLCLLCQEMEIPFVDVSGGYARQAYEDSLLIHLISQMPQASVESIVPGDVGLFWMDRNTKTPQHIAMFLSTEAAPERSVQFIAHSYEPSGKTIIHPYTAAWRRRLHSVFRFPINLVRRDDFWPR